MESTSVKQIKPHKPVCGKHQRDPVKDYENWGAQHLTLSLVPSKKPPPAEQGTGTILFHGFSASLVLYYKSKHDVLPGPRQNSISTKTETV